VQPKSLGLKKTISSRSQSHQSPAAQTIQKHIRNLNKLQQTYSIRDSILSGNPVTSIRGGDRKKPPVVVFKKALVFSHFFSKKIDVLWNHYGQ